MRRNIGLIMITLGAFFLSFAPLIKFYVAEQVIAAGELETIASTKFDTSG